MNTALTRHCPEHRTALLPFPKPQQCVRAEASPWGLPPSVGLCNGHLKAPSSNQAAKLAAQSVEWTGNVCPSSLQGGKVTVPGQCKAQCLLCERPSSRALHSSLLWDQEEIINSHVSGNVCFLASLFSLQGRKCCSLVHSQHLPSQNLFYMQGLEHWVRDQGKIKSHRACPATCSSSRRGPLSQGILSQEGEETHRQ